MLRVSLHSLRDPLLRRIPDALTLLKHVAVWALLLGAGAFLLRGRYDFAPAVVELTRKSYRSSLFFFVLAIPSAHYLLRLSPLRRSIVHGATALLLLVFSLPYRWLHLVKWHYEVHPEFWRDSGSEPKLTFLPSVFPVESFPHERPFLFALFTGVALATVALARASPGVNDVVAAARRAGPWIGAYAAIIVQSWLHTGLRSGYTLNAFFAHPPAEKNWYIVYLFPNHMGAVNADFHFWWALDKYFQGVPEAPETMLLRRPFAHYVGSQFSYFINPFSTYLVLNTLLWLGAVACVYALLLRVTGRRTFATFGAALACIGNGFSYFVSQPKAYLAGYASVAFAFYAFEVLVPPRARLGEDRRWPSMRALLCGVVLGLLACVYDAEPLLASLLIYAVVRRRDLLLSAISVGIAFAIPAMFKHLEFTTLKLVVDDRNSGFADSAIQNIRDLLEHPNRGKIYYLVVRYVAVLAQNLTYGFMVLVPILFFVGLLLAERPRDQWFALVMLAPTLAINAALGFGHAMWLSQPLVELPRLSYIAYPAVYAGAALALERVSGGVARRRTWRTIASWGIVALLALWQNVDAVGYLSPSFHFYFPDQNAWMDAR